MNLHSWFSFKRWGFGLGIDFGYLQIFSVWIHLGPFGFSYSKVD